MATSATIPIQIRVDKKTKEEASELFEELGTSMSGAVNIFLKQCVNTGSIPFRVRKTRYNQETEEAIEEARQIGKNPNVEVYDTFEDYQAAMRGLVEENE